MFYLGELSDSVHFDYSNSFRLILLHNLQNYGHFS